MGYSVCTGFNIETRRQAHTGNVRTCDGCDKCPKCEGFRLAHMYCWRCCGPTKACSSCATKLAEHIVKGGPPAKGWENYPEVVRGYERAVKIVNKRNNALLHSILVEAGFKGETA